MMLFSETVRNTETKYNKTHKTERGEIDPKPELSTNWTVYTLAPIFLIILKLQYLYKMTSLPQFHSKIANIILIISTKTNVPKKLIILMIIMTRHTEIVTCYQKYRRSHAEDRPRLSHLQLSSGWVNQVFLEVDNLFGTQTVSNNDAVTDLLGERHLREV